MWQDRSAAPLVLEPRPSRILHRFLLVLHLLALLALMLPMTLSWWLRLPLAAGLLYSLYRQWQHGPAGTGIEKAVQVGEGVWKLYRHKGVEVAELQPDSHRSRYLVILRFRTRTGRKRQLILLPDSLAEDAFRRLRVGLRPGLKSED